MPMTSRTTVRLGIWLVVVLAMTAAALPAQIMVQRGRRWGPSARLATDESFDGAFNFCRGAYQGQGRRGFGGSWATDYPAADHNFMIRLAELTKVSVSREPTGDPNYLIVRPTDDAIFRCPFVVMWEVGGLYFSDEDAVKLREYLLKGGFLWVDDFWGSYAWENWSNEIAKVLPPREFPIVDLKPDHAIFRTLFTLNAVPQIPSISFWRGSGGGTSERGSDSAIPTLRGIFDDKDRLIVVMTHNTDIADSWEREAEDPNYFIEFSPNGYAMAFNILLYAMSH
jgi:hypothetical protein